MSEHDSTQEKSIVDELNFGSKTSKRVGWEAWEFSICGPHQVEVTNASWGFQKDDHSYIVGIEERDGLLVPAECECKADQYNEEYDCKHKVALATVGGSIVLQAAVDCPTVDTGRTTTQTLEDKLRADGGAVTDDTPDDSPTLDAEEPEACANGNEWCDGPDGDSLPCFDCYELTEGGE
ncbi:SWIM zinc finger family protein [Halorubrum ezzemoulense]|uniref:SWIM zinc finger family protein n=1 Tax=Halorubrum ezzemoulense TaxID=337243 RepID=UPI0023314024|nr:SWIM zinc finger family protein [Halorubrum ezzemoulense]MDB9233351.1 SWIM zinc finger family protein [Halorubrum ezzemoulense]